MYTRMHIKQDLHDASPQICRKTVMILFYTMSVS